MQKLSHRKQQTFFHFLDLNNHQFELLFQNQCMQLIGHHNYTLNFPQMLVNFVY